MLPSVKKIAMLVNPTRPGVDLQKAQLQDAAQALKSRAILVHGMGDEGIPVFACTDIENPLVASGSRFNATNLNLQRKAGKSTI